MLPLDWDMPSLKMLSLSGNKLSGNFSHVIAGSPALEIVLLANNTLQDTLSEAWPFDQGQLVSLDLSNNPGVRGTVPLSERGRALSMRKGHARRHAAMLDRCCGRVSGLARPSRACLHSSRLMLPTRPRSRAALLASSVQNVSLHHTGITGPLPALPPPDVNATSSNSTGAFPGNSSLALLDLSFTPLGGQFPVSWAGFLPPSICMAFHSTALCGPVPGGLPCFRKDGTNLGERRASVGCGARFPSACELLIALRAKPQSASLRG